MYRFAAVSNVIFLVSCNIHQFFAEKSHFVVINLSFPLRQTCTQLYGPNHIWGFDFYLEGVRSTSSLSIIFVKLTREGMKSTVITFMLLHALNTRTTRGGQLTPCAI